MGLIDRFPEINFNNYSEDDVRALQTWGFEAYEELAKQAEAIKALDIEAEEYESHSQRLADLLSKIAVAIRGPEPPLTRYGWADLPERVAKQAERVAALEKQVEFFYGQMYMMSPKMNGQHTYRFRSGGWPMTHCVGPTAEAAVDAVMKEIEREKKDQIELAAVLREGQ